jgi:medium-chain acyl-[acyl-carrier-protein] hydrolase
MKEWLIQCGQPIKPSKVNLICFPFAGGGTLNYRKWRPDLIEDIGLYAINLPGRERFFNQPCLTDYQDLITSLVTLIEPLSDCPLIFFGHSFGGLTAYFTALELKKNHHIEPSHLFISARLTPNPNNSQEAFKQILVDQYQGIPQVILESPELMDLFIPIIQQDFKLYEDYPNLIPLYQEIKLNNNLTTIGFSEDKSTEENMSGWGSHTTGTHNHVQLPGGHFEILNDWKMVTFLINQCLKQ